MHRKATTRIAPPAPDLFRPLLALVAISCLTACTGQAAVDGAWTEGVARKGGFTNILVVGVSPDINQRCAFEQSMTANLRSDTVKATTSCAAMGTKVPLTRGNVEQAVAKIGADAVLATTLVEFSGTGKEGGSADARGAAYYRATDIDHIFGTTVVTAELVTAPSVFSVAGTVRITTNLFETSGATLVYSLDTKAKNLQSREIALAEISPAIVERLQRDGLLR